MGLYNNRNLFNSVMKMETRSSKKTKMVGAKHRALPMDTDGYLCLYVVTVVREERLASLRAVILHLFVTGTRLPYVKCFMLSANFIP